MINLAAIDIGSNGARLLINRVLTNNNEVSFKNIEYVRFPLRLGEEVFEKQYISDSKQAQILKLMQVFKLLMDLHEVDDYMIIATSALREAKNGQEVVNHVKRAIGLDIQVIEGKMEAEFMHYVIANLIKDKENYLHVDVGGGSTELNFYKDKNKTASQSFEVGSIRNVKTEHFKKTLEVMKKWLNDHVLKNKISSITAIGTGGSINKIYTLAAKKISKPIGIQEIKDIKNYIAKFSYEDRINKLKLNPDRADTVIPATDIYLTAMQSVGALDMIVPNVGLKDGIMQKLLLRNHNFMAEKKKITII